MSSTPPTPRGPSIEPCAEPAAVPSHQGIALPKPAPVLEETRPRRLRMLLDLLWLIGVMARTAPRPRALWAAIALIQGFLIPVQLWLTKALVDTLASRFKGGESGATFLWVGLLAGTLLAERAIGGLQPWLQATVREETGAVLQERVMRKAAALDLASFEHQGYYDQLNRVLPDAETRAPQLLQNAQRIIQTTPQLVGYAVALAGLTPMLLLIVAGAAIPTIASGVLSGQINWDLLNVQTRERRLADYYAGILTDRPFAKEVRLYGLSAYLREKWTELFWHTRDEQRRLALRLGIRQRGAVLTTTAVTMFGLWWMVTAGLLHATAGGYALLFQAINGLMGGLIVMGMTLQALGEHSGYASTFHAFARLPVEPVEPVAQPAMAAPVSGEERIARAPGVYAAPFETLPVEQTTRRPFPRPLRRGIRFEDVWFAYPGSDRPALAGVSFEIAARETIALVGENGAGKTTLARLLLGLYQPDAGRITADGYDLLQVESRSRCRAMSAVFQHFVRYPLTLGENVGIGQPDDLHDDSRLEKALERAGLRDLTRTLPMDRKTLLGPDVGGVDLSGGQWQRVAIARSLFRDAEVLALDEPTAALDPLAELAIFERCMELAEGHTVLLISHRLGMARLADRILVLSGGKLVEQGTHGHLLAAGGEYAALFRAQARWYA